MGFSENVSKMNSLQNLADQHPENSFCIGAAEEIFDLSEKHFKMNHFPNVKFTSPNERLRSYKPLNSICQRNRELVCLLAAIADLEMKHTNTRMFAFVSAPKTLATSKPNTKCKTISKINANTY